MQNLDCLRDDYPFKGKYVVQYHDYLWEFCPDHPNASKWGYVQQHRLVVERNLQRFLNKDEHVHHIDEDKVNNKIENLLVLSMAEHMMIHQKLRHDKKYPEITRDIVKNALAKGGLKKAAKELGVHQGTIRNNFPDLVEPYKRKTPANLNNSELIEKIRVLALDERYGIREAVKELGCSAETIMRICNRNSIEWVKKSKRGERHSKYIRKGEEYADNPELIEMVKVYAADSNISMSDAAEELGFSVQTLKRVLTRNNIKWENKRYYSYPKEGD